MWVLVKLGLVVVGFLMRYLRGLSHPRLKLPTERVFVDGDSIHYHQHKNKGSVRSTIFEILLSTQSYFKLTKESALDRVLKGIGFSQELQTRDTQFDQHIYISSDSTAVHNALRSSHDARHLISTLFLRGCKEIVSDGKRVSFHFKGDLSGAKEVHALLSQLKQTLTALNIRATSIFDDRFFYKALLVESVIYSLGVAGAMGALNFGAINRYGDVHLNAWDLLRPGLSLAGFLFISLMAFVVFILRGSSRGHRIVLESVIVLCLALPLTGIDLVRDFNMQADKSQSIRVKRKVVELWRQEHKRSRGKTYTYHMRPGRINPGTSEKIEGVEVPYVIQLSPDNYQAAFGRRYVTLEIGQGALGIPWYRSMRFHDED